MILPGLGDSGDRLFSTVRRVTLTLLRAAIH
jgi:hypothetical protein